MDGGDVEARLYSRKNKLLIHEMTLLFCFLFLIPFKLVRKGKRTISL